MEELLGRREGREAELLGPGTPLRKEIEVSTRVRQHGPPHSMRQEA